MLEKIKDVDPRTCPQATVKVEYKFIPRKRNTVKSNEVIESHGHFLMQQKNPFNFQDYLEGF